MSNLQSLASDLSKEAEAMRAQAAIAMKPLEPFFAKMRDYFLAHADHLATLAKADIDQAKAAETDAGIPPTGN